MSSRGAKRVHVKNQREENITVSKKVMKKSRENKKSKLLEEKRRPKSQAIECPINPRKDIKLFTNLHSWYKMDAKEPRLFYPLIALGIPSPDNHEFVAVSVPQPVSENLHWRYSYGYTWIEGFKDEKMKEIAKKNAIPLTKYIDGGYNHDCDHGREHNILVNLMIRKTNTMYRDLIKAGYTKETLSKSLEDVYGHTEFKSQAHEDRVKRERKEDKENKETKE